MDTTKKQDQQSGNLTHSHRIISHQNTKNFLYVSLRPPPNHVLATHHHNHQININHQYLLYLKSYDPRKLSKNLNQIVSNQHNHNHLHRNEYRGDRIDLNSISDNPYVISSTLRTTYPSSTYSSSTYSAPTTTKTTTTTPEPYTVHSTSAPSAQYTSARYLEPPIHIYSVYTYRYIEYFWLFLFCSYLRGKISLARCAPIILHYAIYLLITRRI